MDTHELERRIASFEGWQYGFEFTGGVRTPVFSRAMLNRQRERRRYFFEPLLELSGGSLAGRKVLDLGCNAGFWSLEAIDAGAAFVLGVDAQQRCLDQATLVFEAKEIEPARYRFELGNALDLACTDSFDVVLCLGLMNFVNRPFQLFEAFARAGAELVVIDTEVSRARLSLFELARAYNPHELAERPFTLVPSRSAVAELAAEFDFDTVALRPHIAEQAGMSDYRRERRLAFICSKSVPLDGLEQARTRPRLPWWLRDPGAVLSAWR
jgi:SAM-dependent methyltransferase